MTVGEKILNLRKARGWSQEELAEQVGVTRQAVSRWEAGTAKPDADKIIAICDLFGVSADYLLREKYEGETSGSTEAAQTSELTKFFRSITLKQWTYFAVLLAGMAIYLVLAILSSIKGYSVAVYAERYDHDILLLISWVCMAVGAWNLFLLPFIKWIYEETV